tara:strand:- start:555 stop:842 length:288 start_codon:yes stop_codon:yes gene_type:complete
MKKSFINTIVKNIIFEVSKEFNIEPLDVNINMEFDWSLEFEFIGENLFKRGLTVRYGNGYTVSHGIHSPSDSTSDLLQQVICGRVAERLLKENLK